MPAHCLLFQFYYLNLSSLLCPNLLLSHSRLWHRTSYASAPDEKPNGFGQTNGARRECEGASSNLKFDVTRVCSFESLYVWRQKELYCSSCLHKLSVWGSQIQNIQVVPQKHNINHDFIYWSQCQHKVRPEPKMLIQKLCEALLWANANMLTMLVRTC